MIDLTPILLNLFYLLTFGGAIVYQLYRVSRQEQLVQLPRQQRRYLPLSATNLLWFALCLFLLQLLYLPAPIRSAAFFQIVFLLSAYYLLLSPLLPLLRRHISPRACALLWLLPADFLWLLRYFPSFSHPLLILRPSFPVLRVFFWVWLLGAALLLGESIFSHLRFRRELLSSARPELEERTLLIWHEEQLQAGVLNAPYLLLRSSQVNTPLSIGMLGQRSVRVFLPEREYSEAELRLIFRHELVHIGRDDSLNKFWLRLWTVLSWFNPLIWYAMGKSADDLELSCDQTVLHDADDQTRRRYAELLLSTAGEKRGFTSCLSADAASLRYRLKQVLHPAETTLGGWVILLALGLLVACQGLVAVSWDRSTAADLFPAELEDYVVCSVSYLDGQQEFSRKNPTQAEIQPLLEAISALPTERLSGNYLLGEFDREPQFPVLRLDMRLNDETYFLALYEDCIRIFPRESASLIETLHLPSAPDWSALVALFPEDR